MLKNWSIKKIIVFFGFMLMTALLIQIYLFFITQSLVIHFGLSFIALFIALIMYNSISIKIKRNKRK